MNSIDILDFNKQFSELMDAVEKGREFVIVDKGCPIARLLPIAKDKIHRIPGSMKGKIKIADDFDASIENITSAFNGDQ